MSTNILTKARESFPSTFDDFFKPWNEWFDGNNFFSRTLTIPAVNITKEEGYYKVSLAAPGMKKEDFNISVDNNMITISADSKEEKEEKNKKYTRQEYNYTSFSRSFTLPGEVDKEAIVAKYNDGLLTITMPVTEKSKTENGKTIKVS